MKSDVPAVHWTYRPIDTDDSDLEQGDIIQMSDELTSVFSEVHPHFTDKNKYVAFLVLTQTCDMVRRQGETCKSRYINLAVIRPLADVLPSFLNRICDRVEIGKQLVPRTYMSDIKYKAQNLLHRIFNQNAQAEGLFYLYPEPAAGIGEHSVALLQVSVAFRVHEHYDKLVRSRSGRLAEPFQSKLGWLIGNLFSRVATRDWRRKEMKQMSKEFLEPDDVHGCAFHWVLREKVNAAQKRAHDVSEMSVDQIAALINREESQPRQLAIQVVLDAVKDIVPETSPYQLNALQARLNANAIFDALK